MNAAGWIGGKSAVHTLTRGVEVVSLEPFALKWYWVTFRCRWIPLMAKRPFVYVPFLSMELIIDTWLNNGNSLKTFKVCSKCSKFCQRGRPIECKCKLDKQSCISMDNSHSHWQSHGAWSMGNGNKYATSMQTWIVDYGRMWGNKHVRHCLRLISNMCNIIARSLSPALVSHRECYTLNDDDYFRTNRTASDYRVLRRCGWWFWWWSSCAMCVYLCLCVLVQLRLCLPIYLFGIICVCIVLPNILAVV